MNPAGCEGSPHQPSSCLSSICSSQGAHAQRHYRGLQIGTCTNLKSTIKHRRTVLALQALVAPPVPLSPKLASGRNTTHLMVLQFLTPPPSGTPTLQQMTRCERPLAVSPIPNVLNIVFS